MKIRTGFVSNSSSSSFICDICDCEFNRDRSYHSKVCSDCIEKLSKQDITLTIEELEDINECAPDILSDIMYRIMVKN